MGRGTGVVPDTSDTREDGTMARSERTVNRIEQARALQAQGETQDTIAGQLGVSLSTVRRWLAPVKENGDPRRPQMLMLRDQGMTLEAIGSHYGITKQAVAQIIGPRRKAERGNYRHFNLSERRWQAITQAAAALGLKYADGSKHGRGNIVLLLDAIGRGDIDLAWKDGKGGMQQ
jgi:hypothetical protein